MRRTMFLVTAMAAALVLCSTAAFAAIKMGTEGGETLTGTRGVDEISGLGGNDLLRGLARSDVYLFDDGFGEDTLEEKKKYAKRGGGSDLVDFSEVSDSSLSIGLVPEFVGKGWCADSSCFGVRAYDPRGEGFLTGDKVDFTNTAPERATGGANRNVIMGGKEKNVLRGGPGGDDQLYDYGGISAENSLGFPALAASDDTFVAGEGGGWDSLIDYGGSADTLDLRAMGNFSEVDISAHPDTEELGGTSLLFTKRDGSADVYVRGGVNLTQKGQKNGVMERVLFADGAKSAAEVLERVEEDQEG